MKRRAGSLGLIFLSVLVPSALCTSSFCMWGSRPDIPEFCEQEQSGAKAA